MAKEHTGRGRLLFKNTAALSAGRLGSKILVFVLVRFYTAVLTKEDYGTADLITSLANFLIPLACAGLSGGFFRFAAEARSKKEQTTVFSAGVCILTVATMGFALLSPLLFLVPYVGEYTPLILLYVLCANVHYLVSDFVRAQGKYTLFAVQGLINTGLNIALNLVFLLPLSMGLYGYVLSVVLADALTSLFLIVYCKLWRYVKPGVASRATVGAILKYSIPLIPATLCWWITNVSDRYMVTAICGEAQNGLYAAAYKIPNILTVACGVFTDAWQFSAVLENRQIDPSAPREERRARRRSLADFFTKVFRSYAAFLSLATGGIALLTYPIASVLFDPSFAEAARYVPILLLATALSALCNFTATVYMVERRGVATMLTSLAGAAGNIALNFVLIPVMGPLGAAIATALSYLLILLLRLPTTTRHIPYRIPKLWLALNGLLVSGACILATLTPAGWVWMVLGLCALLALIDGPILVSTALSLLGRRRGQNIQKSQKN